MVTPYQAVALNECPNDLQRLNSLQEILLLPYGQTQLPGTYSGGSSMGQICGRAGMDDAPISITRSHSQTSVHRDVTAIPPKHAGQSSSRRNALRKSETAPPELPPCRWWNAAV